jgi:hypothetical protein
VNRRQRTRADDRNKRKSLIIGIFAEEPIKLNLKRI